MQNSVHKEKGEVMLWEASGHKKRKSGNVRQKRKKPANIQLIDSRPANRRVTSTNGNTYKRPVNYERQSEQYIRRRKARRRRAYFYRALAFAMLIFAFVLIVLLAGMIYKLVRADKKPDNVIPAMQDTVVDDIKVEGVEKPEITVDLLDVNEYSRPGTEVEEVKNIFVHYTANPRTSAANNRSYFANLEQTHERSASAHLIIGYEGEIIQCIPLEEQAYAVISRNNDSISIECCYLDEDGKFTQETYDSLVHLLAWLVQEYDLECTDILRHYDCGGKMCPLYYVENEDAWEKLLADVEEYLSRYL
ncbi:MAG: N-acetylmuramoyl-L-alanine amidase [Lachnospiraceae bacterium]|nr:N-acetylmuramoyl-L-alanine amidase [Lachnospiraceae bacterium]